MKSKQHYFATGLLAATFGVAGLFSISAIQASNHRLEPEIRFARQIGIYDSTDYSNKMLNRPIAEAAFYRGLAGVLYELDIIETPSLDELISRGIMPAKVAAKAAISRKSATESIFRAISHGIDSGLILKSADAQTFQPFYDWIIEEKYMEGLGVSLEKGIIKGMPNGKFSPHANLKTGNSLILFKRIYDAFAKKPAFVPTTPTISEMKVVTESNSDEKQIVADAGLTLERLQNAGAFSLLSGKLDLQNDKLIKLDQLQIMLQGILNQAQKPAYISEIKYLTRNLKANAPVRRGTLAYLTSVLVRALPTQQVDSQVLYADVKPGSGLARALKFLAKAGISLGYENNVLAGNEFITTNEAVGVLDKVIENAEQMQINTGAAATRDDFKQFKALIEARKARIHRILNRH